MEILNWIEKLAKPEFRQSPWTLAIVCLACLASGFTLGERYTSTSRVEQAETLANKDSQISLLGTRIEAILVERDGALDRAKSAESTASDYVGRLSAEKQKLDEALQVIAKMPSQDAENTQTSALKKELETANAALQSERRLGEDAKTALDEMRRQIERKSANAEATVQSAVSEAQEQCQKEIARRVKEAGAASTCPPTQGQADPVECASNGQLVTLNFDRPVVTCTGGHVVTLSRLTDSAYISLDGENRTNIRRGNSVTYPQGCKISLHSVRRSGDVAEVDIVVACG